MTAIFNGYYRNLARGMSTTTLTFGNRPAYKFAIPRHCEPKSPAAARRQREQQRRKQAA